jgi:hypothetical protein
MGGEGSVKFWKWPIRFAVILIILFVWAYWVAVGIPAMAIYTLVMGGIHLWAFWLITGLDV